jgi:hypothetical protein
MYINMPISFLDRKIKRSHFHFPSTGYAPGAILRSQKLLLFIFLVLLHCTIPSLFFQVALLSVLGIDAHLRTEPTIGVRGGTIWTNSALKRAVSVTYTAGFNGTIYDN